VAHHNWASVAANPYLSVGHHTSQQRGSVDSATNVGAASSNSHSHGSNTPGSNSALGVRDVHQGGGGGSSGHESHQATSQAG
jgi:hypothetical protein